MSIYKSIGYFGVNHWMLIVIFLTSASIVDSSIVVKKSEIVVRKGVDVELICFTTTSKALGCSFKSPTDEIYNVIWGATYEDGRIQQIDLNPNDCAMKINIVHSYLAT